MLCMSHSPGRGVVGVGVPREAEGRPEMGMEEGTMPTGGGGGGWDLNEDSRFCADDLRRIEGRGPSISECSTTPYRRRAQRTQRRGGKGQRGIKVLPGEVYTAVELHADQHVSETLSDQLKVAILANFNLTCAHYHLSLFVPPWPTSAPSPRSSPTSTITRSTPTALVSKTSTAPSPCLHGRAARSKVSMVSSRNSL